MVYNTVSTHVVIERLIRRSRMIDATYADDLLAWLGEFVGNFRMKNATTPTWKPITIQNHIGCLPCGLQIIDAVMWNGHRLRYGSAHADPRVCGSSFIKNNTDSFFVTDVQSDGFTKNEQSYLLVRGADLKQALTQVHPTAYYITHPSRIQTSFDHGVIQLFYRTLPVTHDGFPLIPEEFNCIEAGVWYLMSMLAFGGYKHPDPKFDYEFCDAKFTHHLAKGKSIIRMPSLDKRESMAQALSSLIPPIGYYDMFNINNEQVKYIDK